jgi:hypothetical protein
MAPFGQFTRNLSNAGQSLVLSDAFGNVIDQVHYSDSLPWPDADGNGLFLKLISNTLDNSLASSWIAVSDNTVSADLFAVDPRIRVYPNPTTGKVQVNTGYLITTIDITDLQGKILASYPVYEKDFTFDISHLPDGLYFIRVITSKDIRVEKIIKE